MTARRVMAIAIGLLVITGCSQVLPSPPESIPGLGSPSPTEPATNEPTVVPTPSGSVTNGDIAFIRYVAGKPSVWLIDPDGSNERLLADDLLAGIQPVWTCAAEDRAITAWSPNGEWLAFGVGQGWVCDAQFGLVRDDGTGLRMIGGGTSLAWSPTSREFALAQNIDGGFSFGHEVHFADIDGRKTRDPIGGDLQQVPDDHHARDAGPAPSVVVDADDPVYSPDGTRLAYAALDYSQDPISRTHLLDLASGEAVDIGPGSPNAWSPDGTRLLVQRSEGSVEVGFYIGVYDVAADGSGERKIGKALGQAMPVWSPDGALIAFFHGATVVVLAADGSGRFEIPAAAAPQFGTAIGWSPDGEWLVFSLERGLITTIYVVARDGTGLRALTEGQAPGWQPRYE